MAKSNPFLQSAWAFLEKLFQVTVVTKEFLLRIGFLIWDDVWVKVKFIFTTLHPDETVDVWSTWVVKTGLVWFAILTDICRNLSN